MNFHSHGVIKRKERNGASYPAQPPASKAAERVSSNRVLAGYMAYEFLTKGTLFGEKFDPARVDAVPLAKSSAESKKMKPGAETRLKKEHGSYAEVATILKTEGAHIPGIVNPTQLGRWIRM